MKTGEVPQDHLASYGKERRAVYAVDEQGRHVVATSDGWTAEEAVNSLAIEEYARLAAEALDRVRRGESSPLEFHMYDRRLEPETLASAAGLWRWRVRRHLRPGPFARLGDDLLARYADALGIDVATLKSVPA